MRKAGSYLERVRCKSTGSNSNNSSISSILKEPGKCKLKHQRSVRFEEPNTFSSNDASFDLNSPIQVKPSPKSAQVPSYSMQDSGFSKPKFSDFSPKIQTKSHKASKSLITSYTPSQSPVKIVSVVKTVKPNEVLHSQKFYPKTLNYEFRNESFYQNLNKFINAKTSMSPVRSVNTSFIQENKPVNINTVNKSYESPGNWNGQDLKNSPKKSGKGAVQVTKKNTARGLKAQGPNVLN